MVLKRKRSDSEISTSSSLLSSPLSASNYMSIDSFPTNQQIQTPSLFSSRTRKRHRDNRPSENDVHRMQSFPHASAYDLTLFTEHTLSLLFSAQKTQPASQFASPPAAFQPQYPMPSVPSSTAQSQQSSLHAFWALPSARQSSPSSISSNSSVNTPLSIAANSYFQPTNCEDCDAPFAQDNEDVDMMMDIDSDGGNHACTNCGKQVCHSCAISNLGKDRKCLNCAGNKKVWVGGLGWMDQN